MKFRTSLVAIVAVMTLCLVDDVRAGRKHWKEMGGFKETREPEAEAFEIISVKKAKDAEDDTFVVLQGYIVKSLGGEKYLFRDETGTIKLDIEDKKFRGVTIYPDDFVQVAGEVDKGIFKETEIEVKKISKKDLPTGSVMVSEETVTAVPVSENSSDMTE